MPTNRMFQRFAGPQVSIIHSVAESPNEPDILLWKQCKQFHAEHGHWPSSKENQGLCNFINRLRRNSTKNEFPPTVLLEARSMGALAVRTGGSPQTPKTPGPITRVQNALQQGLHPVHEDIVTVRYKIKNGLVNAERTRMLRTLAAPLGITL